VSFYVLKHLKNVCFVIYFFWQNVLLF
jgi:hypothetical protein